jgi:hypothetical protein
MSGVPLATKYSAETYDQALSNLIERSKREDDGEPIKYDAAAIGMDASTVSVCLKFLGDIGLLDVPKAGNYIIPEDVFNYRTKMGEVREEAKQEVAERLEEYPLYEEAIFMVGLEDYVLDDLAEDVAGTAAVAADQDEVSDVKRSLNILAELGFLEVDEEGRVRAPGESEAEPEEPPGEEPQEDEESAVDTDEAGEEAAVDGGAAAEQDAGGPAPPAPQAPASLAVDLDISMDVTDMDPEEVEAKLEVIDNVLGKNEE